MGIFDPIMWPLIALMIVATSPLFYVPAGLALVFFGISRGARWLRIRKYGPYFGGGFATGGGIARKDDSVLVVVREGEFSIDGGKTWLPKAEIERQMEADQFGGFDRTPRYRHADK